MMRVTTAGVSVVVHCVGLLVFLYLTWADTTTRRTALIGCALLSVLVLGEIALHHASTWPVLARFLRWTLYFQIVAPLALVYGLLMSSRGTLDLFGFYFFACLVFAPALRFAFLSAHGIAEFLANDDPPAASAAFKQGTDFLCVSGVA